MVVQDMMTPRSPAPRLVSPAGVGVACGLLTCWLLLLLLLILGACGGESADAGPAADSPYARADAVTLASGLGEARPKKAWRMQRTGVAVDGELPPSGKGALHEVYRYHPSQAALDGLFLAMWQARFLELAEGSAGAFGSTLTLRWPGGEHSVRWDGSKAPEALRPVLAALGEIRKQRGVRSQDRAAEMKSKHN